MLLVPKKVRSRGTNGQERDMSQVSGGKVERTPRAWLLLDCVLCVKLICRLLYQIDPSLSGAPCPPFYRPRGEQGLQTGERGKNQRQRRSFDGAGSSFSHVPALLTWQTVSGMACSLILIGSCPGLYQQVGVSHPTPTDCVACQRAEL